MFLGKLLSKAVEDIEAGDKLAIASLFEIKVGVTFSLHKFVRNYRWKPTGEFTLWIPEKFKPVIIFLVC